MRLESKKQINVKNKVIGGDLPLICLPIVAETIDELLNQAQELVNLDPDLIEWRVDGFKGADNIEQSISALKKLNQVIGQVPLIYTCRIESEGGLQPLSREERLDIIIRSIETGLLDIVDIELCNDEEFIDQIVSVAGGNDTKVILSYHDFEKTPSKDFILDKLSRAREMGADIAKLAAMPNSFEDVLTMMHATSAAREGNVDIPLVTMSMGETGVVSRVAGGVFGSDITFAIGRTASAPGQIPIGELRKAMSVLYR